MAELKLKLTLDGKMLCEEVVYDISLDTEMHANRLAELVKQEVRRAPEVHVDSLPEWGT